MTCQEVALARAICRVAMSTTTGLDGRPRWIAHIDLVDTEKGELRPIASKGGQLLVFSARSEALVLSTAVVFLAERFGGFSEPPHGCVDWQPFVRGEAHILDDPVPGG